MGMQDLLNKRKGQPGPDRAAIAQAITAGVSARRVAQEQYDDAKLAQLGAALGEREQMEELVQRIGGIARLLDEGLSKLNEAHYALAALDQHEGDLQKRFGVS